MSDVKKPTIQDAVVSVNRVRYKSAAGNVDTAKSVDCLVVEEPLSVVLCYYCISSQRYIKKPLLVTMRTPSDDDKLVLGLLVSQSIIQSINDIKSMEFIEDNHAEVTLVKSIQLDWEKLTRLFVSHSGCGVCGTNNVKALALQFENTIDDTEGWLNINDVLALPSKLKLEQRLFDITGGVHSAGFYESGQWQGVYEDVGRHNAVDKVIGNIRLNDLNTNKSILMLSGRISFELVQKAIAAKIPVIVAIGAPSSLALLAAKQFNLTLIGFTQSAHCNIYSGDFRLLRKHEG